MAASPDIRILSAGAPKTGVRLCAEVHASETNGTFTVEFATAPTIRERMATGTTEADVVVGPVAAIEAFEQNGSVVVGSSVELGSVFAGVAVRNGALEPDVSSADSLRKALIAADIVIYNRASSGQYIETMVDGLGLTDALADKTLRTDTGSAAMEALANSTSERPIGFGQITEIRLKEDLGIHLVGPLPKALEKKTTYRAALTSSARDPEKAKALLDFYGSEEGQRVFVETGIV